MLKPPRTWTAKSPDRYHNFYCEEPFDRVVVYAGFEYRRFDSWKPATRYTKRSEFQRDVNAWVSDRAREDARYMAHLITCELTDHQRCPELVNYEVHRGECDRPSHRDCGV